MVTIIEYVGIKVYFKTTQLPSVTRIPFLASKAPRGSDPLVCICLWSNHICLCWQGVGAQGEFSLRGVGGCRCAGKGSV